MTVNIQEHMDKMSEQMQYIVDNCPYPIAITTSAETGMVCVCNKEMEAIHQKDRDGVFVGSILALTNTLINQE